MLKYFEVEGYRNFKNKLCLNLSDVAGYQFNQDCITPTGVIGKALIYGRNATGKTNLGKAIMDIVDRPIYVRGSEDLFFLNADTEAQEASFTYVFQFDNDEVCYSYTKASQLQMTSEKFLLNGQTVFYWEKGCPDFKELNLSLIQEESLYIEAYSSAQFDDDSEDENEGPMPFLKWLFNNRVYTSDSIIRKLQHYLRRMTFVSAGQSMRYGTISIERLFRQFLQPEIRNNFQTFLNEMGIPCELDAQILPDGRTGLYFVHRGKNIPFNQTASSGTIALLNVYLRYINSTYIPMPSLLYLDEFDAFYHYEMSEKLISYFKHQMPNTQVIATTHNTNLMSNELMRPDCLFILSVEGRLTSLKNATTRELREGHNLEKMYISGEFERYE